MQFKRWRLSAARPLVNAGLGITLLFTASACGGKDKAAEEKPESRPLEAGGIVEMPAVWATSPLESEVQDLAIAGGIGGTLAVAYAGSGLQLFNLEGDRMTDVARYEINALGRGITTVIGDDSLTIFPGIDQTGHLKAYIFGGQLPAPVESDLPIDEADPVLGLCASPLPLASTGLLEMAYWTKEDDRTLKTGILSIEDEDFEWRATDALSSETPLTACEYLSGNPVPVSDTQDAELFKRGDFEVLVAAHSGGEGLVLSATGETSRMAIRDGITIRAPEAIDAVAAYGTPLAGGYPRGVIVIAGETSPGQHQAVFVDPTVLTEGE